MTVPVAEAAETRREKSRISGALRALRHRNFQLFFGGQLVSLIGTWMQTVAQSWLVYRMTGSALLLGTVAFMGQFPVFLLGTVGGMVADRKNRHRVVITTQTLSMILAFLLAGLTLSGRVRVWEIMVLATMLGIVNSFDLPARQAFLVDMVGKDYLMNAIALNSSLFNGARVVGPAIAGVLVAWLGEGWCFFANGVSFLAVIGSLLSMRLPPFQRPVKMASMWEHVAEGFRFVRRTGPVRALLLLVGLVSLVAMPYAVLMPIFADRILHAGARGLGILMGATGIGAVSGALTLAMKKGLKGLGRWVPMAVCCSGLALIAFSFSRIFWLSAVLLVPVGYGVMLQMSSTNTLIQAMVPDHLRGRVMAVYAMMFMGMVPIGALLAGVAAHHIGAALTVACGGALAVAGAALFARNIPKMRNRARELIVAQGMEVEGSQREIPARGIS